MHLRVLSPYFRLVSVSFLEPLRELGRCVPSAPPRGQLLLLAKSLTIYLRGVAAALGLGLAAGAAINSLGITFVPIGSNLAVPFYIDLELRYFLVPAIITLLMTGVVTMVPTLRTARLTIASVLRHD